MQKKFRNKKLFSLLLCMMLTVAMAFGTTGCNGKSSDENAADAQAETASQESVQAEESMQDEVSDDASAQSGEEDAQEAATEDSADAQAETGAEADTDAQTEVTEIGEGQTEFTFVVADQEGNETQFLVHTDKETVGEALLELGLIAGDESEYGLYVKTVNGITADYDADQTYWAFYVNGEYAQTGVDSTAVTAGDTYSFKVEK